MPISLLRSEDRLIWPFRWDGGYTVKVGYHVAKKQKKDSEKAGPSTSTDMADLWKEIWGIEGNKVADGVAKYFLICQLEMEAPTRDSRTTGQTQNTVHSKSQRQGNLNFAESLWQRDLIPNLGTLNPLSVVNGADATLPERRNVSVNNTNTPRQGNQVGKEKFGVAREPTIDLMATNITDENAVDSVSPADMGIRWWR
ncbi:hypothetical protein Ahy_B03g062149 [Arachis hypogaea]|uniref:Uncharacterized protein n=1 Tax=Arachis hypogaea TaxID=3818 RepID=A0A444ZT63_ARAHY|nr:hypothetical protein Ahy_B03g062149 [Arachis hypogaea]